jgi:hypothetical protein
MDILELTVTKLTDFSQIAIFIFDFHDVDHLAVGLVLMAYDIGLVDPRHR